MMMSHFRTLYGESGVKPFSYSVIPHPRGRGVARDSCINVILDKINFYFYFF